MASVQAFDIGPKWWWWCVVFSDFFDTHSILTLLKCQFGLMNMANVTDTGEEVITEKIEIHHNPLSHSIQIFRHTSRKSVLSAFASSSDWMQIVP